MKLNKQQKILAVVFGIVLIYLFYQYLWSPLDRKITTIENKIKEQKKKLGEAEKNVQNLEQIKKEMESLLQELRETEARLPWGKEMPSLLRLLARSTEKYQVTINNLSAQTPSSKDYFIELPFAVQSVANYHSLATFLSALAQGQRIINTANLRITAQSIKEDKTITASFNLITYAFKVSTEIAKTLPAETETKPTPAKVEEVTYFYQGKSFRDPFVPLIGEMASISRRMKPRVYFPNLRSLALKGIIEDSKSLIALIIDAEGRAFILKEGKLLDPNGKIVPGISGTIKKDKIMLLTREKKIELELREAKK